MAQNIETGKLGEDVACEFLVENGFRVLARNVRNKWGEIDVVAQDRDKTLVFVEVKTIRSRQNVEDPRCGNAASGQSGNTAVAEFMPEDQMSPAKIKKFKRAAELLANDSYARIIKEKAGWRLDFIGVIFDDSVKPTIRHYKNIS